MTARRKPIDPAVASARARIAGLARAASQTDDELSEAGKRAANARWAKHRAEREAAGLSPTKSSRTVEPSARALDYWLGVIDREQPDREWSSPGERRRAAVLRAKQEAARVALKRATDGASA